MFGNCIRNEEFNWESIYVLFNNDRKNKHTANIEASGLKFILSDLDFSVVVVVEVVEVVVLQVPVIMGSNSHMESSHLNVITSMLCKNFNLEKYSYLHWWQSFKLPCVHTCLAFSQSSYRHGKKYGMVNWKLSKLRHLLPPAYLGGTLALAGAASAGAAATLL